MIAVRFGREDGLRKLKRVEDGSVRQFPNHNPDYHVGQGPMEIRNEP